MNDPQEFIERASRFIKQQRDMYGDFSVDIESQSVVAAEKEEAGTAAVSKEVSHSSEVKKSPATSKGSDAITPEEKEQKEEPLTTAQKIARCETLEELRALCEQAEELHTDLKGTNLVFGVGNPNANLMIVGEAPGYNEDQQGEPFVGQAGQLLDKIMAAINFERKDIYIANILKHRPPNNRNPKAEERERSLPFLLRQIELIDPKLILCVGKVSATTLLDKETSLSNLRGKFHEFHGRELMATYHPAALLRNQQWKRPTWEDVQKLRKRYDELVGE
ncbi:uracil-DNA glycosylase [Gracilimonas mengyeensis]|uniref:Type-4 uracil-DNA glycosylase n=1 Tax=Gracilimonas mengyeensis TaxID=1302730 RepID=A0A521FIX8_9BACT|nr:uracil-DNA glycosylase [Gracilimonas mengyeensis]SMO96157.1 DNA polymerase [Gracilimonas mengyeensis]